MKPSRTFLFLLCTHFAASFLWAQSEPVSTPGPDASAAAASEMAQEAIRDIVQASQDRRWTDVLQATDMISDADPAYLGLMNIRLSALVQVKDYDQALELLSKLAKREEGGSAVHDFNYGEIYFLKKNYKESIKHFEKFLAVEGNENNALARFKLYLGNLLGGQESTAEELKSKILPSISHPLYYYVQAASEFHAGNDDEARAWLKSASSIYSLGLNVAFADTFKEVGWLEPHEVTGFPVLTQAQLSSLNAEFQPQAPNRPKKRGGSIFEGMMPSLGGDEDK
jgi:tetratricopeptide (TPR) repeat protein